jgi:hypothetical protein
MGRGRSPEVSMSGTQSRWLSVLALAVGMVVAADARVKVDIDFDKTFDFSTLKTWAWNPSGPGEVKMARTAEDDPEAAKKLSEPWIVSAVADEMGRRGLTQATANPDATVTYYLLLSTSMNSQVVGQFLPATTAWALPPFLASTQSLEVMNQGSLVLDISAKGNVVWRGVARSQIKMGISDDKRQSLIREAAKDLLKRFPPKP